MKREYLIKSEYDSGDVIVKNDNDKCNYKYIKLDNQMRCLLI